MRRLTNRKTYWYYLSREQNNVSREQKIVSRDHKDLKSKT